ncbi:MAG: PAS domain S-box protein [bacterium]|nr:MAG: PAS domain S-box protein [bacterium]
MDQGLSDHLLSNALEGIVLTDLEGNIISSNRTTQQILGYSPDELEGQFIGTIFPTKSTLHLLPNLMKLARERSGFAGEILLKGKTPEEVIVRLTVESFPGGDPAYLLFRFLDWREVKSHMEELRETSQLAILGRLTRSVAHEILNPVTAIGAYAKKLAGSLAENSREAGWADQISSNVQVLEYLVRTVQNFVNLPPPRFKLASMGEILEESIENVAHQVRERGIQVTRDVIKKLPRAYLDPDLLLKALTAILLNGIERMPSGGDIVISDHSDNRYYRVMIDDTGPSLKPYQIEDDLSPLHVMRVLRTDLNLAIAKRIVADHGGEMDLTSIDPAGLRVVLTLPLDRRKISRTALT